MVELMTTDLLSPKGKHFAIRYRTKDPDYSHLPTKEYDWTRSVYGNVEEEIPKDIPKPLGKRVVTTTFLDSNLLHDIVTGKSFTAVLHFVNTTPTDWFLKRQATVETATYGSELVATKWFRVKAAKQQQSKSWTSESH